MKATSHLTQILNFDWQYLQEIVAIGKCRIEDIDKEAFYGLPNLEWVTLPCSLKNAPSLQYICNSLSMLALSKNPIEAIPDDYFNGCHQLDAVGFEFCKLSSVPNVHPLNHTLRQLQLKNNRISSISHLYDIPYLALDTIILSENNISHIEEHRLTLPVLTILKLDGNALVTLGDVTRCGWGSRVMLHLAGNPWHCNESLSWLVAAINGVYQGNTTWIFSDCKAIRCTSPADLRGRSIDVIGKAYTHSIYSDKAEHVPGHGGVTVLLPGFVISW